MYPFWQSKSGRSERLLGGTVNIPKEIYATRSERSSAISYVIQRMVARTSQSGGDDKSSKRGNSRCFSPGEPRHTSCPECGETRRAASRWWGREKKNEVRTVSCARKKLDRTQQQVSNVMDFWRAFITRFINYEYWIWLNEGSREIGEIRRGKEIRKILKRWTFWKMFRAMIIMREGKGVLIKITSLWNINFLLIQESLKPVKQLSLYFNLFIVWNFIYFIPTSNSLEPIKQLAPYFKRVSRISIHLLSRLGGWPNIFSVTVSG